ncbi:MAG: hypothetical protein FWG52_02105 [Proteobacteria bacterium]|nr:hypothetical protein [Pseudomonadota bacterium]
MTNATLLERILSDGVHVRLTASGTIKLSGRGDALERWAPVVKANKTELVRQLSLSCWWRVRFADGGGLDVFTPSGDTQEGILRGYPAAVSAEPFEPKITTPSAPMSASEREAILAWLYSIGERAKEVIDEVLAVCDRSASARAYALCKSNKETEKH